MPTPQALSSQNPAAGSPLTRLFELSRDLLCVAGIDGYFKLVNPSWTRVLGWTTEELLARPIFDFIHPEDRDTAARARAGMIEGAPVNGLENRYRCKDGSWRWLAWQASFEPGAGTVFAIARDITDHRRAQDEKLMQSKRESTGTLASGFAHDYNNLLAGVRLSLDLITHSGPLSPDQQRHLRRAHEAVSSAHALTTQIITFAREEILPREWVDLRPILQSTLHTALNGTTTEARLELAPDLWPAFVERERIPQVFLNLVTNAREATHSGGTISLLAENLSVPTTDTLPSVTPGDYVLVRVVDRGRGIPPSDISRIFDPYFSTKPRGAQKGMGLGLAICREIIRRHGGFLFIEPTENGGTTIRCLLPAARPVSP